MGTWLNGYLVLQGNICFKTAWLKAIPRTVGREQTIYVVLRGSGLKGSRIGCSNSSLNAMTCLSSMFKFCRPFLELLAVPASLSTRSDGADTDDNIIWGIVVLSTYTYEEYTICEHRICGHNMIWGIYNLTDNQYEDLLLGWLRPA